MSEETQENEQVPDSTASEPSSGDGGEPATPDDIENDPAYNPDDEGLKDLKGG